MRKMGVFQEEVAGWHLLLAAAVMLLMAGSAGAWYYWPRSTAGGALNSANGFPGLGSFNPDDMKDMKSWEDASKEMTEEEKKEMEEQLAKLGIKPDGNTKMMTGGNNSGNKTIFMARKVGRIQKTENEEKEPESKNDEKGSESKSEANSGSNPTDRPMMTATAPLFGGKKPEARGSKLTSLLILLTSVVGSGCFIWLALRQRNA